MHFFLLMIDGDLVIVKQPRVSDQKDNVRQCLVRVNADLILIYPAKVINNKSRLELESRSDP